MTNRCEWNFVDMAVMRLGAVHVPIYPTITADEFRFILEDSGAKMIFASAPAPAETVTPVARELPALSGGVFSLDDNALGLPLWSTLRDRGAEVLRSQPALGPEIDALAAAVKPSDLATLIYTSGTTGKPKGVMLSHANLVSNCLASTSPIGVQPGERTLSFLPLCHIFERTAVNVYLYAGVGVYYAQDLTTLAADLREVRPHFFTAVPRLLEKVYEGIVGKGKQLTGLKRKLFVMALDLAHRVDPESDAPLPFGDRLRKLLADKLIFSKWREAFGGQVRAIVSGSAALNPKLARAFWNAGLPIYEGYGPTEAAPVISANRREPGNHKIGTVGLVIPGGEVKLAEDGEILYRGPNVMMGYYRRPDLTAETVDSEGYLHTGDVGEWLELKGVKFLRITDRKKEMFKTSGGKYIAPQPMENKLKESPLIGQAMVIGEYRKFPGALIVPNFAALREKLGGAMSDAELARSAEARKLIEVEIKQLNLDLARYAQIKNFALLDAEWTPAAGELTPTMKLKRREIMKRHAARVEEVYAGTVDESLA